MDQLLTHGCFRVRFGYRTLALLFEELWAPIPERMRGRSSDLYEFLHEASRYLARLAEDLMTEKELIDLLDQNRPFTLLLRGIPGAGKSRLAQRLAQALRRIGITSADKFMPTPYDGRKIHECHKAAFRLGVILAREGSVIVDNTNLTATEIASWYMTHECGFSVDDRFVMVLEVPANPEVAFARQLHGVPPHHHAAMVKKFHERAGFLPAWRIERLSETP